ncbi:MAG: DUF2141 domain-containing protein [Sandarakinorhabdus sp.]|nr:DUF2141 domain-containing protein [Sandarakinorhabdus sp.]
MHMIIRLLALTTALAAPALAADTASLDLRFTGIETPSGAIMAVVFANAADYAAGKPVRAMMIPAKGATAGQIVAGLAPGRYAVKAFHDIDGDGQMGANPFGQPTEPFGFSNNAPANMGPAPWSAAAFDVGPGTTVQTISIK